MNSDQQNPQGQNPGQGQQNQQAGNQGQPGGSGQQNQQGGGQGQPGGQQSNDQMGQQGTREAKADYGSGQQNQQGGGQGQAGQGGGSSGQQQQFDTSGGGQQGGGSGQFAGQIQQHMNVTGSDGWTCGTVDHLDGDRIKLTKDENGEHKYVPLSLVEKVENNEVVLRERGDQAFGMSGE